MPSRLAACIGKQLGHHSTLHDYPSKGLGLYAHEERIQDAQLFPAGFFGPSGQIFFYENAGETDIEACYARSETEYLITQTMMEYWRTFTQSGSTGYFSHQPSAGGTNVVLFAEMLDTRPSFPLRCVENSLTIYETATIEYEHIEQQYRLSMMRWKAIGRFQQKTNRAVSGSHTTTSGRALSTSDSNLPLLSLNIQILDKAL